MWEDDCNFPTFTLKNKTGNTTQLALTLGYAYNDGTTYAGVWLTSQHNIGFSTRTGEHFVHITVHVVLLKLKSWSPDMTFVG